jgi:hypothetical protein
MDEEKFFLLKQMSAKIDELENELANLRKGAREPKIYIKLKLWKFLNWKK